MELLAQFTLYMSSQRAQISNLSDSRSPNAGCFSPEDRHGVDLPGQIDQEMCPGYSSLGVVEFRVGRSLRAHFVLVLGVGLVQGLVVEGCSAEATGPFC